MKKILIIHAVKEEYIPLSLSNCNVKFLHTGVGKTNSTFKLTRTIIEEKPDFVLNIGTAGTISHNIGDIFIATQFIDRDYESIKLPGITYELDGLRLIGKNKSLKDWILAYSKLAICSTGDTFITELSSMKGDIVDMEAYAQAFVCKELAVPFVSIKYITDIIGQNSVEHWENKLTDARLALAEWFEKTNFLSLLIK